MSSRRLVPLLIFVSLGLGPIAARPARADSETSTARRVVGGAVNRARRKIAFGPMVGVGGAYRMTASDLDAEVSFGLGLTLFKIRVMPTPKDLQELIVDKVKSRLASRVEDMIARGEPAPGVEELASLGREVAAEVKAELLGKNHEPRLLEKPRLAIALEGVRLPRSDTWQVRATFGIGISKVTIGPSIGGSFGDVKGLYLGGELGVHLTPWKGMRSPVVDLFVRADFGVTNAARDADLILVGTRFLLDVI